MSVNSISLSGNWSRPSGNTELSGIAFGRVCCDTTALQAPFSQVQFRDLADAKRSTSRAEHTGQGKGWVGKYAYF